MMDEERHLGSQSRGLSLKPRRQKAKAEKKAKADKEKAAAKGRRIAGEEEQETKDKQEGHQDFQSECQRQEPEAR